MQIFNSIGSDAIKDRQIINGNSTNINNLNNVKYLWAIQLYKQMRNNFWQPEKVDVVGDINSYKDLSDKEKTAYDGILSYLIFLDSIQTVNIPNILSKITAPEIRLCLTEQASQEALHSASYQYLIETILPIEKKNYIYDYWREDKILADRCKAIANFYQNFIDDNKDSNLILSLVANYFLEGIYFYNGFMFFYNLASRSLMNNTADMIKLIHRDELSHVRLYQKILEDVLQQDILREETIYTLCESTVKQEIAWSDHIIGENILGITETSNRNYTRYLANLRLKAIGLEPMYETDCTNPYGHLEKIADVSKDASSKTNFFESSVTSYNMATNVGGWNF
jgi:ribonucleoside-diphosphate reductase beta chain